MEAELKGLSRPAIAQEDFRAKKLKIHLGH